MGRILHLIPDEKVTDNVIENFENVYSDNLFFVLGDKDKRKYCTTERNNVVFGGIELFTKENVDKDINAVVVHGLNSIFANFILQLDSSVKIAWFAWGFDIYGLPRIKEKIYAPLSLTYLKNDDSKFGLINLIKRNRTLRGLYYRFIRRTKDHYTIYEQAHRRIDFFCTYIEEDYKLFSHYHPNKISYQEIGYFSINQYLVGQLDLRVNAKAKNILVGNSVSVENNHLDVFEKLNNTSYQGQAIVPLSYGNDSKYKNTILKEGERVLNSRFYPLLDFMDREKYFELLTNCSAAIFYHYRQQGMGNILALLYMGMRIYLSEKNPVYHYLKRIGIVVFSFDTEFSVYSNTILDEEKQKMNRSVLDKIFNEDIIRLQHSRLIEKLTDVDR